MIGEGKNKKDERKFKSNPIAPANASECASKTKQWQLWRHHGCDELRQEKLVASEHKQAVNNWQDASQLYGCGRRIQNDWRFGASESNHYYACPAAAIATVQQKQLEKYLDRQAD